MTKKTTTRKIRERFSKDGNKPLPAIPREMKRCPVCHYGMLVSDGQIMNMHKKCKNKKWHERS